MASMSLEGTEGVPRKGGRKQQPVCLCFVIDSLHVQALMLTDVQTPFLGTPFSSPKGYRFQSKVLPCGVWGESLNMVKHSRDYARRGGLASKRVPWFPVPLTARRPRRR